MSSRSGRRSRSRSRNRDSRRSSRREKGRPWVKKSRSRSSSSSSSSSRSRSSRRKNRQSRSRSKSPVRPVMSKELKYVNARVFVANFASSKANHIDLHKIFEKHGKIVDVLVHHNGYGFVQFANVGDAKKAIESENGTVFHGRTLKCKMAMEGKKENEEQKGGGDKGRERGGGPPVDNGVGRGGGGGPGFPPPDDRFGRDNRDPFGPPRVGDPYMRGRELPPPPMDYRGLPGSFPRDFRDLPPDYPLPPRGFRDMQRELPLPPRDPMFDDPYRRPPPPDLFYDRLRDDPFRRDPFRLDPYRDSYRDPFGPSLLEPVAAPKKAMAVDCEIIVMSSELRRYADAVEQRLKNTNLLTNVTVIREDQTIQQQVEDAAARSCLFAITINSQNEIHRSLTVNILHGVTQEHRNMPLEDAVDLVGRSFEKFLTAEKEKLAAKAKKEKSPGEGERKEEGGSGGPKDSGGPPHPKDIGNLLTLLVDNRPLSVEELDRLVAYLQDKRDKVLGRDRNTHTADRDRTAESSGLQQPQPQVQNQQPPPPPPQYQQQEPQYQQSQQPQQQYQQPQQQYEQPQQQYQQPQQPQYQQSQQQPYQQPQQQQHYQEPPQQSPYHQTQPQPLFQPQQQQQQQQQQQPPSSTTQDIRTKILDIMNGTSTAPTSNSLPLNTLTSHTTPLLPATVTARPPPPPPPPPQQSPTPDSSAGVRSSSSLGSYQVTSSLAPGDVARGASYGMMTSSPAGAALRGAHPVVAASSLTVSPSAPGAVPRNAASVASSSGSLVSGIPATLINFDNPTVQKALDNLIQSGPSLLKTISATAGQGLALAMAQQPGGFRGAGRPPQPPH